MWKLKLTCQPSSTPMTRKNSIIKLYGNLSFTGCGHHVATSYVTIMAKSFLTKS